MRSTLSLSLCLLIVVPCSTLRAEIKVQYLPDDYSIEFPEGRTPSAWHRFQTVFEDRSDDVFADRLHSFQLLKWSMNQDEGIAGGLGDSANHAALGALSKSVEYGLREAALELPIFRWLKEHDNFFTELVKGTVNEVAEEAVSPMSPAYGRVERSWWRRMSEGNHIRYGLRPLRRDPYAFMSFRVDDFERLNLLGHIRYYMRRWHQPKLEFALSLPLPHGFAIDAGTTYEFAARENGHKFVVKLFKELKSGGVIHFGVESKQRPVMLAGISLPW